MRKADYEILAAAIKKHRDNQFGLNHHDCAKAIEDVARTFVRFAHVDKAAFLKACGID
jgi:hypothetical protein